MPLFSSDRERRLWAWTLAAVVAIYATVGLARSLSGALRDRELLGTAFVLAFLLVIAAVVVQALWRRPGGAEIGVTLGIIAVYLLLFVRISIPEERTHLVEYGVVGLLIHEALAERASQGRRVPKPALLAILLTALVGVLDESIQAFLPSRVFDPVDMLFNVLAATMAVAAIVALRWARRRGGQAVGRARRSAG